LKRVPPRCFARYLRGQIFAVQVSKDRASSWTVTPIGFCDAGEVPAGNTHLDLFRKPVLGLVLAGPCFGQRRDRIGLENLGNIHLEMNKE
jgi:hypothetical protein